MGAGVSTTAEEDVAKTEQGRRQWTALASLSLRSTPDAVSRLRRVSADPARVAHPAPDPLPDYFVWDSGFVDFATRLLVADPALDRLREKTIRKQKISEEQFWKRYLYELATEFQEELRPLLCDATTKYARELSVAMTAVRLGCSACRAAQKGIETLEKGDRSPVTAADFASQAVINSTLRREFPQDQIVAEEDASELQSEDNQNMVQRVLALMKEGAGVEMTREQLLVAVDEGRGEAHCTAGSRYWALDPIDGTLGFLRGGQYAVCLALVVEGRVTVAVLGCPSLARAPKDHPEEVPGRLFYAVRGAGAFVVPLDAKPGTAPERVHVSKESRPQEAVFCESVESGHTSHDASRDIAAALGVPAEREPVRMDSQCKYAVVACGEASVYLRVPSQSRPGYFERIWDHAAGALIVEEAGGAVTDMRGETLNFATGTRELRRNRGVVATNGLLHAAVVEAAGKVLFSAQHWDVRVDLHNKWGDRQKARAAIAAALGVPESVVYIEYSQ